MKIRFDKEYLRELYETGRTSDKKHRFQPGIITRYQLRIKTLEAADDISDILPLNSLNYEVLKGDKAGVSSIRVNDKYRIEFIVEGRGEESAVTICNILELSNHYR